MKRIALWSALLTLVLGSIRFHSVRKTSSAVAAGLKNVGLRPEGVPRNFQMLL